MTVVPLHWKMKHGMLEVGQALELLGYKVEFYLIFLLGMWLWAILQFFHGKIFLIILLWFNKQIIYAS